MKPVDQMTDAEVAAERAAIAAEREQLAADRAAKAAVPSPEALAIITSPAETVDEPKPDEDAAPAPWPHGHGRLKGHLIEVRAPAPAALVAISMTGSAELTSATQIKVFSTFMTKHISPKSLDLVLGMMADPDSGVEMQDVITAMTEHVEIPE